MIAKFYNSLPDNVKTHLKIILFFAEIALILIYLRPEIQPFVYVPF